MLTFIDYGIFQGAELYISLGIPNTLGSLLILAGVFLLMLAWWFLNKLFLRRMKEGILKSRVRKSLLFVEFYAMLVMGIYIMRAILKNGNGYIEPVPVGNILLFALLVTSVVTMIFYFIDTVVIVLIHYGVIGCRKCKCKIHEHKIRKQEAIINGTKPEKRKKNKKHKEPVVQPKYSQEVQDAAYAFTRNWLVKHIQVNKNIVTRYEIMLNNKEDYINELSVQLNTLCENPKKAAEHYYNMFINVWK